MMFNYHAHTCSPTLLIQAWKKTLIFFSPASLEYILNIQQLFTIKNNIVHIWFMAEERSSGSGGGGSSSSSVEVVVVLLVV